MNDTVNWFELLADDNICFLIYFGFLICNYLNINGELFK